MYISHHIVEVVYLHTYSPHTHALQTVSRIASDTFATFNAGDTITNVTLSGNAFVTSKVNSNSIYVTTTDGGFIATNQVKSNNDNSNNSNLTATVTVTGTPVTNLIHEEIQNESKRRIKLLKPQFLNIIVKDLEDKLGAING